MEIRTINIFKDLIEEWMVIYQKAKEEFIAINKELLDKFGNIKQEFDEQNKEKSIYFNVFNLFKPELSEPKHSFLLANLLNPNSNHGQEKLFLSNFLELIGIENSKDNLWNISLEKGKADEGRIDILLTRNEPDSVVIIENKSNNAKDKNISFIDIGIGKFINIA